ncbi:helix-turn-helix domain-containing protein [Agromyces marinus]|uniref:helix-turn-helix domain-containing protein n=1 Tax=Agromyces marinus TaxID=1389020 RepID=UPI001F469D11|nr:helix-turn-helix transcriptional regulator [Agromyces marinus]UIP58955.1 hypothetical protein DSM26151_18450 [Agromyces marinus]
MPRSELAQRAGISRNTEWNLRNDYRRARLSTLREIALACGYDIDVTISRTYEPVAVAAARQLVGDLAPEEIQRVESNLLGGNPEWAETAEWVDRLERFVLSGQDQLVRSVGIDDPLAVAVEASEFASPQVAPGAVMLAGRGDIERLMSAATATSDLFRRAADTSERFGHEWVFSGRPALEALGAEIDTTDQVAPTVVWTTLPQQFSTFLGETHRRVKTVRAANVIIAPLAAVHLAGAGDVDGAPYVAPVQCVIDSLGVGGPLSTAAHDLAREW